MKILYNLGCVYYIIFAVSCQADGEHTSTSGRVPFKARLGSCGFPNAPTRDTRLCLWVSRSAAAVLPYVVDSERNQPRTENFHLGARLPHGGREGAIIKRDLSP